jgi:hypothetical protein
MRVVGSVQRLNHSLAAEIVRLTASVVEHRLFSHLHTIERVRCFMEHHVWAVWDFMTLLKSLQAELAPVSLPWRPRDAESARLINAIVLGEESDLGPDGAPASHFEVYLAAMDAAGADATPIRRFVALLARGLPWEVALDDAGAPPAAARFVRGTLALLAQPLPARLAAFTLGREDVIPAMFRPLVAGVSASAPGGDLSRLVWYLERHVTVDGDEHGPMTARLFDRICLADATTLEQALAAARAALAERLALWDAVDAAIERTR